MIEQGKRALPARFTVDGEQLGTQLLIRVLHRLIDGGGDGGAQGCADGGGKAHQHVVEFRTRLVDTRSTKSGLGLHEPHVWVRHPELWQLHGDVVDSSWSSGGLCAPGGGESGGDCCGDALVDVGGGCRLHLGWHTCRVGVTSVGGSEVMTSRWLEQE